MLTNIRSTVPWILCKCFIYYWLNLGVLHIECLYMVLILTGCFTSYWLTLNALHATSSPMAFYTLLICCECLTHYDLNALNVADFGSVFTFDWFTFHDLHATDLPWGLCIWFVVFKSSLMVKWGSWLQLKSTQCTYTEKMLSRGLRNYLNNIWKCWEHCQHQIYIL